MPTINASAVQKLEKSEKVVYNQGVSILLKLLDNIIRSPEDIKFRSIRLENKKIKDELLSCSGMKELLFEIGFLEQDGKLILPTNVLIAKLKKYRAYIQERLDITASSSSKIEPAIPQPLKTMPKEQPIKVKYNKNIMVEKLYADRVRFPRVLTTKNSFLMSLESMSDGVMQYEDQILQQSALQIIPVETLKNNATENLRKIQKQIKTGKYLESEPHLDSLVVMEFARWFKENFFRWINKMPCKVCGDENTQLLRSESQNGVRLEVYQCQKRPCQNATMEFYRYNDVAKLLKTRAGRCGEWANCFTFLCRCLGYEARHVYSTSDHVWTEVYSPMEKRWIHIDPSENVFDSPLMYEHGWKRNVAYVVAFSKDDVQDVTWRYTNQTDKVLKARNFCTEPELLRAVMQLRAKRQTHCSDLRKMFLKRRTLAELVDFFRHRQPTEGELHGRSSGGLTWRLERGEEQSNNFYIINLTDSEINEKQFNIRYSCAKNVYERYSKNIGVQQTIAKWETLHFMSENIRRKVEKDWKMSYLARADKSPALLIWKFDFSSTNLKIKKIDLKLETTTFNNAVISVKYLNESDKQLHSYEELVGSNKFSIRVDLSGGLGDNQWQHTQLFRQSLYSKEFPFELEIQFL